MAAQHTWQLIQRAVGGLFADRAMQLAAAISYYALFAVFPVTILAVGAFSLVIGEQQARQDVIDFLMRELPTSGDGGRQDLERLLDGVAGNRGAFGVIGVGGLLISASGLMGAIRNGLNTVWDVEDRRPPLRGKGIDLLLVLGIGAVIAASFAISISRALVRDVADELDGSITGVIPSLVNSGTWVLPLLLSFAIFTFLYRFIPATDVRWRDAATGAAFTTIGYELAKIGFGVYLDNLANYGAVYGSLGAVIAFVFFVFLVANIFLLGAEVAREQPRVLAGHYDDDEDDDRTRGERIRDALRALFVDEREP